MNVKRWYSGILFHYYMADFKILDDRQTEDSTDSRRIGNNYCYSMTLKFRILLFKFSDSPS